MDRAAPYEEIAAIDGASALRLLDQATAEGRFAIRDIGFDAARPASWFDDTGPRLDRLVRQQWMMLEPYLVGASRRRDLALLAPALVAIEYWLGRWGAKFEDEDWKSEDFVAHPTAVAYRFYRLAYVVDTIASENWPTAGEARRVLQAHGRWLLRPGHIRAIHNHGLFQAIAMVLGASRFPDDAGLAEVRRQGEGIVAQLVAEHFAADGCHLEHSPGYQLLLARALGVLTQRGLVADDAVAERIAAIAEAAPWFADASGLLANIGDTHREAAPLEALEGATQETAPRHRLFAEAGYWCVKAGAPGADTFLVQIAGFHSRAHKHADTASFLWRDRGRDILIDAGRYDYRGREPVGTARFKDGFWYADPARVHVESTRAHNTVEIDGANHPRYRVKPFGSTLAAAGRFGDVFAARSSIGPQAGVNHLRVLVLKPGEWLLVFDRLRCKAARTARQWFQVHPHFTVEDQAGLGPKLAGRDADLYVCSLIEGPLTDCVARGERWPETGSDPGLRGWWSPGHGLIEPCTSIALMAQGETVQFATLISFAPAIPDLAFAAVNITGRTARFRWASDDGDSTVRIALEGKAGLEVSVG
jgi:hypothetical protein